VTSGRKSALTLLVAVLLLWLLLYRVDWAFLIQASREIDFVYLALAVATFMANASLEVERLTVVMSLESVPRVVLWRLHFISSFLATFSPGQIGGDAYKSVQLADRPGEYLAPALRLMQIRIIVLIVAFVASAVVDRTESRAIYGGVRLAGGQAALIGLLAVILICAGAGWVRGKGRGRKLRLDVLAAAHDLTRRKTVTLLALSVAQQLLRAATLQALCRAAGQELGFSGAVMVSTTAAITTLLPISFAGLGLREGAIVVGLRGFGIGYEPAVLVAFLGRLLILVRSLCGGLWLWHAISDAHDVSNEPV
jgi:uncharacterized membrane protein YbhN (UPF0104 family)